MVLNVGSGDGETSGLTRAEHLQVLAEHMPKLRVDIVLADSDVAHPAALTEAAAALGATVIRAPLAATDGSPSHDVDLLAAAFSATLSR